MTESNERLPPPALAAASLRECEERFRAAFETAAIGIALVELDGRLRVVNHPFSAMLGYDESELRAKRLQDVTHPDDRAADDGLRAQLLAGEIDSYRTEKRYIDRWGHLVWGILAVSPVRDAAGAPAYFVVQIVDVTALKEAEQAAAHQAAELERSNPALEQFAYVASHELQEPLRTVAAYAQLLAATYRGRFDARADRWIGYVIGSVERMQRLIDALLALAHVRTDGRAFAPTDIAAIVVTTWQGLQAHHPEAAGHLDLGRLPTIAADAAQIAQLFQNLLGNAMKYRRPEVPLAVVVSARRRNGPAAVWQFAVRDNGIGLDMANAERIFEIFQRLHRDDEYTGTGIGLAICRRIVERHGGRIWVESIPGEGATFLFTLPEHEH